MNSEPTYEGSKLSIAPDKVTDERNSEPTYEGSKPTQACLSISVVRHSEPTYEGSKLASCSLIARTLSKFGAYL